MNVIYVDMDSSSQSIALPVTLSMEGHGCALFEIRGRVKPYTSVPLYMCVDFIDNSVIGPKLLPILRRVRLKRIKGNARQEATIEHVFSKMLWLPVNRSPLEEIRVYLSDANGQVPSFDQCHLTCTLVNIPRVRSR